MDIYEKAVMKFGIDRQVDKLIEESSELVTALLHKRHNREHNVYEEFADLEIMMEQLRPVFNGGGSVDFWKKEKLERLRLMLNE